VVGDRRLSCRPTGRPGNRDRRKDRKGERVTHADMCGRGHPVSKERHRTMTIVKTLFAEITAALMHVIDYGDAKHRRQVQGTM